ncbi:hypothetical protein [Halocatena marina]|uniref:hypothetical protein n=1 Tax=Halocatena marina TaxID=2934937 RepID=UPI00200C92AF|nr:hypothetical protein [Halocatena marina]
MQSTSSSTSKRTEIERSKQETQRRIESGCYQGRPLLGTRFDAAGEGLIPDSDEWPTIMDAFEFILLFHLPQVLNDCPFS